VIPDIPSEFRDDDYCLSLPHTERCPRRSSPLITLISLRGAVILSIVCIIPYRAFITEQAWPQPKAGLRGNNRAAIAAGAMVASLRGIIQTVEGNKKAPSGFPEGAYMVRLYMV